MLKNTAHVTFIIYSFPALPHSRLIRQMVVIGTHKAADAQVA